jgi:hypothetical protein
MHALLRLSLLVSSGYLGWQLIRYALHGNLPQLRKVTGQLRALAVLNGGLLLAWLVLLLRK